MKCPRCGKELEDGNLYCDVCGEEIHIVPDFEPEIENRIEETLQNVAEILSDDDMKMKPDVESTVFFTREMRMERILSEEEPEDELSDEDIIKETDDDLSDEEFWDVNEVISLSHSRNLKKKLFSLWKRNGLAKLVVGLASVVVLIAMIVCIVMIVNYSQNHSYEYQKKQAIACFENQDYNSAVQFMEQALLIDSENEEDRFLLADYYYKNGQIDNAILTLKELIAENGLEVETAYTKLFSIYSERGEISEISKVLLDCEDSNILEQFQQYIASKPEFSVEEGSYGDVVALKLTANTTGTIYYTLDGSAPDITGEEYTSPIFLESGYYTVKAIFVNSYGLYSEVASKRYEIKVTVPATPEVNLESGEFTSPEMIVVNEVEGCTVYYTTDGTSPGKDSNLYKGPIFMPLGTSQFAFVAYSSEDVPSEVTMRVYTLQMETTVTAEEAANLVTMYRFSLGGLIDTDGHLSTISGRLLYMCESSVAIEDKEYYVISEYYEDPVNSVRTKTGLQYAVCTTDASIIGALELSELGNYYLVESAE